MRQVSRTLTAADDGVLVGHRVLICDRDREVERARAPAAGRGRDPRGADAVSGAQCECLRRAVRALDQRRVPRSDDPVRRAPSSDGRSRSSSSTTTASGITKGSRIGSSTVRALVDAGQDSSASAARRLAELLRASGVRTRQPAASARPQSGTLRPSAPRGEPIAAAATAAHPCRPHAVGLAVDKSGTNGGQRSSSSSPRPSSPGTVEASGSSGPGRAAPSGSTGHPAGRPRVDSHDGGGESALGRAENPRRTLEAGHRRLPSDGRASTWRATGARRPRRGGRSSPITSTRSRPPISSSCPPSPIDCCSCWSSWPTGVAASCTSRSPRIRRPRRLDLTDLAMTRRRSARPRGLTLDTRSWRNHNPPS